MNQRWIAMVLLAIMAMASNGWAKPRRLMRQRLNRHSDVERSYFNWLEGRLRRFYDVPGNWQKKYGQLIGILGADPEATERHTITALWRAPRQSHHDAKNVFEWIHVDPAKDLFKLELHDPGILQKIKVSLWQRMDERAFGDLATHLGALVARPLDFAPRRRALRYEVDLSCFNYEQRVATQNHVIKRVTVRVASDGSGDVAYETVKDQPWIASVWHHGLPEVASLWLDAARWAKPPSVGVGAAQQELIVDLSDIAEVSAVGRLANLVESPPQAAAVRLPLASLVLNEDQRAALVFQLSRPWLAIPTKGPEPVPAPLLDISRADTLWFQHTPNGGVDLIGYRGRQATELLCNIDGSARTRSTTTSDDVALSQKPFHAVTHLLSPAAARFRQSLWDLIPNTGRGIVPERQGE